MGFMSISGTLDYAGTCTYTGLWKSESGGDINIGAGWDTVAMDTARSLGPAGITPGSAIDFYAASDVNEPKQAGLPPATGCVYSVFPAERRLTKE